MPGRGHRARPGINYGTHSHSYVRVCGPFTRSLLDSEISIDFVQGLLALPERNGLTTNVASIGRYTYKLCLWHSLHYVPSITIAIHRNTFMYIVCSKRRAEHHLREVRLTSAYVRALGTGPVRACYSIMITRRSMCVLHEKSCALLIHNYHCEPISTTTPSL